MNTKYITSTPYTAVFVIEHGFMLGKVSNGFVESLSLKKWNLVIGKSVVTIKMLIHGSTNAMLSDKRFKKEVKALAGLKDWDEERLISS